MNQYHHYSRAVEESVAQFDDQFEELMSLALDNMLTPEQSEEFNRSLRDNPDFVDQWELWQMFDRSFLNARSIEPPADFVVKFEGRLWEKERRRRMWLGLSIGLAVVAMWGSLIAGLAGVGAYVMFNQSSWLTGAVRLMVYCSESIQSQLNIIGSVIQSAVATPELQGMALVYAVFAGFTLWFWAKFLRRSVELGDVSMSSAS